MIRIVTLCFLYIYDDMRRLPSLVALCLLGFVAAFSDGAVVPLEILSPEELEALDKLAKELNFTELERIGDHPHARLNVIEIIKLYDYKSEVHTVTTSDGYILELHRICGNKENPNPDGKPVAYLQHGLISSSADWVLAGPDKGFGFILADAGYDVWMGNVRGSKYSRRHIEKTVDDKDYWGFSWHEIGVTDLPTMIDYVLKVTGQKKVYYTGHSQGSTSFFVMTSERPEYNDKIHVMFSLAPVAYCSRMFSPIFQALSRMVKPINLLADLIGMYEFKPSDKFFKKFTSIFCQEEIVTQPICMNVLFMVAGFDKDQLDTKLLPAVLAHVPAGAAVNQFVHYAQIIKSGHFRQFDHGTVGNLKKYGKLTPPVYNLKNVKAPVSLHYSVNDWLSNPADVEKLHSKLPNPVGKFRVSHDKFNHVDYIWGKDAKTLLYNKIMSIMQRYKD